MSDRTSKVTSINTATDGIDGASLQDMFKAANIVVTNWQAMGERMVNFARTSFQANMTMAEEMRRCASPRDMMDLQMRMMQKTYSDMLDEAREMTQIMVRMQAETMQLMSVGR